MENKLNVPQEQVLIMQASCYKLENVLSNYVPSDILLSLYKWGVPQCSPTVL